MTLVADVFNQAREKTGTVELSPRVFGAAWAPRTVRQVVDAFLANQRQPLAHAKGRGEVSGGGRKPWKQKHTGRARHGSTRSPLWRGGGVTHGPLKERDFSKKVNEGMKRAALRSALSKKWKDGELSIVDSLVPAAAKTKVVAALVKAFAGKGSASALLVSAKPDRALARAGRNLTKVETANAADLHTYAALAHRTILIEKKALETLNRRLG